MNHPEEFTKTTPNHIIKWILKERQQGACARGGGAARAEPRSGGCAAEEREEGEREEEKEKEKKKENDKKKKEKGKERRREIRAGADRGDDLDCTRTRAGRHDARNEAETGRRDSDWMPGLVLWATGRSVGKKFRKV